MLTVVAALVMLVGWAASSGSAQEAEAEFQLRAFIPAQAEAWAAFGVGYGPFREGQKPGGPGPTKEQIREDLQIIAQHWQMLRTYGSDEFSRFVCEVIREDKLPLKLMVGAWIATEQNPTQQQQNQAQVDGAIAIANDFPDVVVAISVGNESQVSWSFHKVATDTLLRYVRQARRATKVPITVADDFLFWTDESSQRVAAELDFLVTHVYAMWHAQQLENALTFTKEKLAAVRKVHPEKLVVLGEAGWCTEKLPTGDQAKRLQGTAGEEQQAQFYAAFSDWVRQEQVPVFYFEAFDEPWKGSDDPREAEKHWGLFRVDRRPKAAMNTKEGRGT